ncbi:MULTISPECIES: aa3-type cytochrome oxidase subunit III [unclassified Candidatus Sulfotelmatobacter]|uniref:aa3-type cytochrome oxidase subunit III n=1 Tax=unclassified Candidatus Sulfotelmatobacter TaxID=2635724 RepID=UPI001682C518|nr:heme-copper oxidase subunit III [Kocuria sp. cx-116]MBD2761421.1 heme-copper oxidase subunit III [Kocuria sp. cx-116]
MTTATHTPAKSVGANINRPNLTSVGTIVWLSSEVMFFAGLFAMYFTLRATSPELWGEMTSMLNVPLALINTIVLVLSSVTCQFGVFAAERLQPRRTGSIFQFTKWGLTEWFALTFLMGAVFVSVQVYEYSVLVSEGVTIAANAYGSAFYITTGFHALHVTGGLIAFLFIMGRAYVAKRFGHYEATSAIVVSYYWHFVDVVWIVLFILVYFIQ